MKIWCVITIKLNTLTDIPYQMAVGGRLCIYVKTCESGRVKDVEQRLSVYNAIRIMESQCISQIPCYLINKRKNAHLVGKIEINTALVSQT